MGSRRSRKARAIETLAFEIEKKLSSSSELSSAFMQDKDTENNGNFRHACTLCPSWTRCLGWTQWQECKERHEQRKREKNDN